MTIGHVLLIDDNAIDNYISKAILSKSGLAEKISIKVSASDALAFLETLKNCPEDFPDTIFLDIQMPEMDGFGFLELFSEFPKDITAKTAVFMLTSSSDPADIKRSMEFPAVMKFFSKPLTGRIIEEVALLG